MKFAALDFYVPTIADPAGEPSCAVRLFDKDGNPIPGRHFPRELLDKVLPHARALCQILGPMAAETKK